MKNNISIHIPTPCHENWDAMTPQQQGRFCQSCAKTVVDFTAMTDNEVLNYFTKASGNTCGRFTANQLQRPLQSIQPQKPKAWWIAAMMPLLLLFKKAEAQKKDSTGNVIKMDESVMGLGEVVVVGAFSRRNSTDYWQVPDDGTGPVPETPKDNKNTYKTTLTVTRKKGDDGYSISGRVVERRDGSALPFVTVAVKGSKTATLTDAQGYFTIKDSTKADHAVLTFSYVGFENAEAYVRVKDAIGNTAAIQHTIKGKVVEAGTNNPMLSASIQLKGSRIGTTTNADGSYVLQFTNKSKITSLVFSAVGYQTVEVPLRQYNIPDTIKLDTVLMYVSAPSFKEMVVVGYGTVCKKPKKIDTIPTIIRKVFKQDVFKAYPNPAPRGSLVNIEVKKPGTYQVQLFSNSGNLVAAKPFDVDNNTTQLSFDIPSNLTAGMYYIKLVDVKKKKEYTDKIVVQ